MRTCLVPAAIAQGLILNAAAAAAAAGPTVNIDAGTLQGGLCTNNPQAAYFKSIPYAQPPVGDLRFAPPQPYTPRYKSGSRNSTTPSPSCIQFSAEFAVNEDNSEDCLYVDVWAPANATKDSALPVRAWVYGGSNIAGSISYPLYDGCNVPSTDALMVSINYRLGPLGFLALEEAGIGGNQAIQDLLLALQWIQENIAAFGGDPNKVLLHGQSAGATDSFTVATLPQAPKIIRAVILQSGGGRDALLKDHTQALGQAFAKGVNCSISDSACLKSVSVTAMKDTFTSLPLLNTKPLGALGVSTIDNYEFAPYVDGKIVPTQPSKSGVNVPAIFGSTTQDGTLFTLLQYVDAPKGPYSATAQDYTTFLAENFGAAAPLIEHYYPLSAFNASPFPAFTAIADVLTASSYRCSAYRGANTAAAKGIPVWSYLFGNAPKCPWFPGLPAEALPLIGATHSSEIPFTLGNTENLPQPDGNCSMSSDEKAIAAFMNEAWTSFAASQKPTADPAKWPAYGGPESTDGVTFVNSTVVGKIDYSACKLWDEIDAIQVAAANNGSYAGSGTNANGANATTGGDSTSGNYSSTTAPTKPSSSPNVATGGASGIGANAGSIVMLGVAAAGTMLL